MLKSCRAPHLALPASRGPSPTGSPPVTFRPKFITFDCYGTLTHFRIGDVTREIFADRVPAE